MQGLEMDPFTILILIGRPASGKSEIIDYLEGLDPMERLKRFYIAEPDILDDFPMLWAWFEEDAILSRQFGKPRLHTDEQGYFKYGYLWHLLIERLCLEYRKRRRDDPDYHHCFTTIIEFSRGSEHGGYRQAFQHLSDEVLGQAAVMYVKVSFEESLRKNRRRFNPERPDSILEHALSDEKLERLYREDDWGAFSAGEAGYLAVRNFDVPYVVFENEDDVTTANPDGLTARLENTLKRLTELR
jgi:hypothetical protein